MRLSNYYAMHKIHALISEFDSTCSVIPLLHSLSLVDETDCTLICQPIFILCCHRQHNWNTLIRKSFIKEGTKMETLQELSLPHETGERCGPSLTQHLQRINILIYTSITIIIGNTLSSLKAS